MHFWPQLSPKLWTEFNILFHSIFDNKNKRRHTHKHTSTHGIWNETYSCMCKYSSTPPCSRILGWTLPLMKFIHYRPKLQSNPPFADNTVIEFQKKQSVLKLVLLIQTVYEFVLYTEVEETRCYWISKSLLSFCTFHCPLQMIKPLSSWDLKM